jgi:4'-phosphopantetheinyl transferase
VEDPLPAPVGSVRVIWLDLDLPIDVIDDLRSLLIPEERRRLAGLASPLQQLRATVRIARCRQVIAEICGVKAGDVVLGSDSQGRPIIVSPRGGSLEFSTSHCTDISVIAISQGKRVGVDVDALSEIPDAPRFISWVASESEVEKIFELPHAEQQIAMLRLWTRKEAYLKATGEGIGGGIKHLEVPLVANPWNLPFTPFPDSPKWALYGLACPRRGLEAALVISKVGDDETDPAIVITHL